MVTDGGIVETAADFGALDTPEKITLADIQWALTTLRGRVDAYQTYREYYGGLHRLKFATTRYRNAFGDLFRALGLNMMKPIVSAFADGLQIESWLSDEGAATLGTHADELWKLNRMDQRAGEVHQEALREGDAYVIVWPEEKLGYPVLWPNKANECVVRYSRERPGQVEMAAKLWRDERTGHTRLNLYYADRIEYFVTRSKTYGSMPQSARQFVRFMPDGSLDAIKNPYGVVPVFHFANDAGIGELGTSELHDAIPVQDKLNKTAADWMIAQEFQAFRQRWATGIDIPIDDNPDSPTYGEAKKVFQPGVDNVWWTAAGDARFGEFGEINLSQLIESAKEDAHWLSRITGVPMHYFHITTGDFPSGEAQRRAEARMLKKIADRQTAYGNVWEDIVSLALHMWNKTPSPSRMRAVWTDPTPHSEKEEADIEAVKWNTALIKNQVGVPSSEILLEMGYTQEQVDDFAARIEEERQRSLEQAQTAFNSGGAGMDPFAESESA